MSGPIRVAGVPVYRAARPHGGLTWRAESWRGEVLYRAVGRVYDELAEVLGGDRDGREGMRIDGSPSA